MSTSQQLNEFWIEFLELYKSLPQLWKRDMLEYSQKHTRDKAYRLLLAKYQEYDQGATIDNLKRKITNMRSSFRREYIKCQKDKSYEPMLWYYPHMEFLKGQEDESVAEEHDTSKHSAKELEQLSLRRLKKRKRPHSDVIHKKQHNSPPLVSTTSKKNSISSSRQKTSSTPDEAKALSATWEVMYRNLGRTQRLYANRAITEVLYLGALTKLHENSYKTLDQSSNPTKKIRNPINITTDTLNYNDDTSEICDTNEALQKVRQLEDFALRENHEAIELIVRLEELLSSSASGGNEQDEQAEDEDDEEDYDREHIEEEEYST